MIFAQAAWAWTSGSPLQVCRMLLTEHDLSVRHARTDEDYIAVFQRGSEFLKVFAAGEWEACGDRFYERHELYTMAWSDVRLDQMRQDAASYADDTCSTHTCRAHLISCKFCHVHRAVCTMCPWRCKDVHEMQLWTKGSGAFQGLRIPSTVFVLQHQQACQRSHLCFDSLALMWDMCTNTALSAVPERFACAVGWHVRAMAGQLPWCAMTRSWWLCKAPRPSL